GVGLARERRDLLRKPALQLFGGAGADRREAFRNALERRQPEAHLERGGEQQDRGQYGESDGERAVEGEDFVLDVLGVAGYRDQETAVVAETDQALDQAQTLLGRARHVALARAVRRRRHAEILQMRKVRVPQRARGPDLRARAVDARHLPVPAG